MKRFLFFILALGLLFSSVKEFNLDGRVFKLKISARGAELLENGVLIKEGGRNSYYIYPYICADKVNILTLIYTDKNYVLYKNSSPVLSSHQELYSPRGICFQGKEIIVVGKGRKLLVIQGNNFQEISPIFNGVLLNPRFNHKDGDLFLLFNELWRGVILRRKIKFPFEQKTLIEKELRFPPSGPFWYNYELEPNTYIAFGDSITYGCGYGTCDHDPPIGYPSRLEILLNKDLGESHVLNRGVPSETTFEGVQRISSELSLANARYLLLMEGTNDVVHAEYPLSATEENLRSIINKSMGYGTLPVIATIIPRTDWFWYHEYFHQKLLDTVKLQRKLAKEYSLPLADMFKLFMDYPGGWENLISDGNHPTTEGYQMMAEEWEKAIKTIPPYPPYDIKTSVLPGFLTLSWKGGGESDLVGFYICKNGVCVDLGLRYSLRISYDELQGIYEIKSYDKEGNESQPKTLIFH